MKRLFHVIIISSLVSALMPLSFAAQPSPLQSLRVYLDWYPNIEFAGMYAAIEKGWYKDAGIDLKTVFSGLDIIPNVLKGQADIGMHSAHDLIRHIGNGAPVKAFAAQYQLNPNSIIVPADSDIHSLKDLRGKTLAIFSPQEYDMYRVMLGFHGLSLSDCKFKNIDTFQEKELIQLLKNKVVDAMIAWEFNWTITFSLLGYPVRVFPGYENGFHFYGVVFFAPSGFILSTRDLLRKFLEVTFRGWREVYNRPEHYANLVVEKYYPKDHYINGSRELTLKQQLAELKLRRRYFTEGVGMEGLGKTSTYRWQKSLDIARKNGILTSGGAVQVSDVFDSSVWGTAK